MHTSVSIYTGEATPIDPAPLEVESREFVPGVPFSASANTENGEQVCVGLHARKHACVRVRWRVFMCVSVCLGVWCVCAW